MLDKLLDAEAPRNIRLLAAAGLVPLPADQMLQALVHLAGDADPEVSEKARSTIREMPEKEILAELESPQCSPQVLEFFARSDSTAVQEAVILNPQAPGAAIAGMAAKVSGPLLELVLVNRTRILEAPGIIESLRQNPAATAQTLGLAAEIESEFFGSKKPAYAAAGQETQPESLDPAFAEILMEANPADLVLEGLPTDPQERDAALGKRLDGMTVRQKIHAALIGPREMRSVLIRDPNKEVARAVMQSPKLTSADVEGFAAMRTVGEEVLRMIAGSKNWTRSYAVIHNLARNPKTPAPITQRIMMRLVTKDLSMIARNREISEAVRRNADRLIKQRSGHQRTG